MALNYDRSFAPYVLPADGPLDPTRFPEPRWAVKMALGQLRARVGGLAIRLDEAAARRPRLRSAAGAVSGALQRLAPAADGRIPSGGDAEFAYARLAGTNPLMLRAVRSLDDLPPRLRLDDDLMRRLLATGATLAERIAAGDVFVADYRVLRVRDASELQPGKFVAPAVALFCYDSEVDSRVGLVPLAVETPTGRPDGEASRFTPLDGPRWRDAKRMVEVADVHASELLLHLARAHFMMAPFSMAMRRKLPRTHALREFLFPHLRFNPFIDRMAWAAGVRDTHGILVGSLGGTAAWSQRVAKTVYYDQTFRQQHFERDLEARGLSNHIVDYPYRDDGRLLWAAIARFVSESLAVIYPDDAAIAADADLQAFIDDLVDPDGGNVRGLLAGERLDTRDELAELVTQVVFVSGPLHALSHYGSAAQLQDVRDSPSWLESDPLDPKQPAAPGPIRGMAAYARVTSTNCRYGTLGDFSDVPLGRSPRFAAAIARFQSDLVEVEATINARNLERLVPFVHFLPSRIPNGTSA